MPESLEQTTSKPPENIEKRYLNITKKVPKTLQNGAPEGTQTRSLTWGPLFEFSGSILEAKWESLLAPFASLLGYLFSVFFWYPKKHDFGSQRVPKWSHFGGHFWYLSQIGRKSFFYTLT